LEKTQKDIAALENDLKQSKLIATQILIQIKTIFLEALAKLIGTPQSS